MENRRPLIRRRWDPFTNQSGETIPPWSCMRMEQTLEGLNAYKPNDELTQQVMFNGPMPVVSGGSGLATFDEPIEAAYNVAEGPPLVGGEWGPVDGEWRLGEAGKGFVTLGESDLGRALFLSGTASIMGDAPELYDGVTEVCLIDGDTSAAKTYPAEDTTVSGDTWTTVIGPTSYTAQAIGTVKIRVSIDWRDSVSYSQDSYEFRLLMDGSEAGVGPALICTGIGGFQDNRTAIFPVTVADLDPHDFEVQARQSTADGGEALLLETSFMQPGSGIGITVEHRTALLPEDVVIGDPECVVNPTNCCADDTTSSSSDGDGQDCPYCFEWNTTLMRCVYVCGPPCEGGYYWDPETETCIPNPPTLSGCTPGGVSPSWPGSTPAFVLAVGPYELAQTSGYGTPTIGFTLDATVTGFFGAYGVVTCNATLTCVDGDHYVSINLQCIGAGSVQMLHTSGFETSPIFSFTSGELAAAFNNIVLIPDAGYPGGGESAPTLSGIYGSITRL